MTRSTYLGRGFKGEWGVGIAMKNNALVDRNLNRNPIDIQKY